MVSRRVIRSYQARYGMGANKASMYDLTDAIDVHAHARGQDEEEPLHAAQQATRAGMNAILFKSISPGRPWEVAKKLQDDVDRWAEKEHLRPAKCWSAWVIGIPLKPIDFAEIKAAVEGGITGMWMPPVTSAWSMFRLGGRGKWLHESRRYDEPVPPLAWEEARKTGVFVLDDHGRLLPVVKDVVRLCADRGVSLSLGHLSPQEMEAIVDEMTAFGYRRVFIDHPFSEVFEHDVPTMKRWADAGVRFALTWDELSPLLGIDPQDMVAAIRALGPEHFMLSSHACIPVLPPPAEASPLLTAILRAYGSPTARDRVGRSFIIPRAEQELELRRTMMLHWARATCGMVGRSPDFMNVTFAAWSAAAEYFGRGRPEFARNIRRYYEHISENDLTLTHSLINLQRSRTISGVFNLQEGTALQVKRETGAGIVVNGARVLATLGPLADEIAVYSPRLARHTEPHSPFALNFAIPCGTPGLRFLCRESFDLGQI